MRYIILIISFTISISLSFSQDCSGKIPQKAIDRLNNRIRSNYSKLSCPKTDSVLFVNIFDVGYEINADIDKTTFANKQFLSHLIPSYHRFGLRKYLDGMTIIWNNKTDYIAIANPISVFDRGDLTTYKELVKTIVQNNINCVYELGGVMWGDYYVGIGEDDQVYVLVSNSQKTDLYLISDFPNENWIELFTDNFLRWQRNSL